MSTDMAAGAFAGLRILLAEDEFHILILLEDMLGALGCEVVETASDLATALDRAQRCEVDVAVLDVNLAGKTVYPVADALRRRNIPIVFCSGYGKSGIDPEWALYPVVQKPIFEAQLARAIERAVSQAPQQTDRTQGPAA
jgi:CheY-like chemotaxis protein